MAKVIQFEINTRDPKRAIEFYEKVFGWKIGDRRGTVAAWPIETGPDDEPGIHGTLLQMPEANPGTWHMIQVPSIDEYLEKVVAAGGEVFASKRAITGQGWDAYVRDPEGSIFGLFEPDESAT